MKIVISLVECDGGKWNVCRDSVALFHRLKLGPAIRLARELARDEHRRSGHTVSVLLPGPDAAIRLAHYALPEAA
ncbi:hypothetical protein [Fulvimonas yonginensis]|uniref:Uncharacterized protein n=1 Tax=Fulvimonas yonginensis TaxID=1495200 RepID=A0ABU8J8R2_9GAMM